MDLGGPCMEPFPPFPYTSGMTYDQFKTLCEQRRSIRYFSDKPVTKEEVQQLLELGRLAPSVENLQPWFFHVISSVQLRKKLMEASCYGNFIEGASVFIVVTANRTYVNKPKEPVWNPKELEYSCMAAMENMLLGATSMELGSSWVSLHHGVAHGILGLAQQEVVVGGIMIGHYKSGEEEAGSGHTRMPLEDMYTYHE